MIKFLDISNKSIIFVMKSNILKFNVMRLEIRDNNGLFLFSTNGEFSDNLIEYLNTAGCFTVKTKIINGIKYRCFCNETDKSIRIKNDYLDFYVRIGGYIKILY